MSAVIQELPVENPYPEGDKRRHLKIWPKGVSGNPNGRPTKAKKLQDAIEQLLAWQKDGEQTQALAIGQVLIDKAKAGDPWAINFLFERQHGKVAENQNVNYSGTMQVDVDVRVEALCKIIHNHLAQGERLPDIIRQMRMLANPVPESELALALTRIKEESDEPEPVEVIPAGFDDMDDGGSFVE